jgi:TonB family protein
LHAGRFAAHQDPLPETQTFRRQLQHFLSPKLALLFVGLVFLLSAHAARPQDSENTGKASRKLISQVAPDYPPDLKRAAIGGVVRLDIVVAPGGKVDNIIVAGGNPILAESASRAVKQWKYAPANSTSNIRINVRFDPSR